MLVEVGISAKSPRAMSEALEALAELVPPGQDFGVKRDEGLYVLSGDSEEQIASLLSRLEPAIRRNLEIGAPQVAYRETLSKPVTVKYTHKKQTGGSGQFAEVTIDFAPLPLGSGFVFENDVVGGAIPKEFIPSVEKGLKAQKESGLLAGFPVIDFSARLVDGKYHEVDSNALTFDIAARAALRELASRGAVKLLEPIMKVEVVTPEDFLGGVIGDLNSRRGWLQGTTTPRGNAQVVTAMVPLSNMFGYINTLRSMSQGRAQYSTQFDHYEQVPLPDGDDDPSFPPAVGMRA
jgi:elongation factor G